jgi:glyoxylase-like metal-dependent hydrolase (beta-lactamase superfamily II)
VPTSSSQAQRLPDAGGYEVWLLHVGSLELAAGLVRPDQAVTICVNALLLRGHGETLLVDSGSGAADVLWPGAAQLEPALEAAGARPDEVDAVVLTHLDFDHAGGTLAGTWPDRVEPAFPRVIVSSFEFDSPPPESSDESDLWEPVVGAYRAAGRLELADDGAEFRPGLRFSGAPGHRRGHSLVLIGDELVYGADLVHDLSQLEHLDLHRTDTDPQQALATRTDWFERLAATGTPVVFSHVPGRGRLRPGPTWEPDR